jgi:hypothetical protein
LLESEKDIVLGLVDSDWVRATSGAIGIADMIVRESCPKLDECSDEVVDERNGRKKVLAVLGAAGKYASTMKSTGSPGEMQAEREQIIKELVARTVNRTARDQGFVVSVGGNLGLLGGARMEWGGDRQFAFPVQLGLGLGLQSYHSKTIGFSALLTALDLGQYVVFNSGDLKVQTPDAASSVMLGLSAGIWVLSRETPVIIGPYGAVSPFLKTTAGQLTYQVGLAIGIYIPLLDFN